MAKHINGKFVSKGSRNSCNKLVKKPAITVGGSMYNAMREAFLNTAFPDAVRYSKLGQDIINAVQREPKLTADQQRGWSTKLSFRTFHQLKNAGILA